MDVQIRPAEAGDAAELAALAARTFRDTFGAQNRPEDMAEHLAASYGEPLQRAEIAHPDMRTLLAVGPSGPVAFAQLRRSAPPACVTSPDPVEILRFYVDRPWHGQGIAQRLMAATLAQAAAMGAGSVWLGVWEHNPRAVAFYRKYGFVEVGAHEFLLGRDRQRDLVMVRSAAARGSSA